LFTAVAVSPTTGNPVVAFLDSNATTSPIHVYQCKSGCATSSAVWSALGDVDGLGASPFTNPGTYEDPRPLDVAISSDGATVWVAYGTGPALTSGGRAACSLWLASNSLTAPGAWGYTQISATGSLCNSNDTFTNPSAAAAAGSQYGRWLSLALDSSNRPAVFYTAESNPSIAASTSNVAPTQDLPTYTACSGTCGTVATASLGPTVISGPMSGRWSSLKFDNNNNPAAVFFADQQPGNNHSLIWVRCGTAPCTVTGGWVGQFIEISNSTSDIGRFARLDMARPNTLGNAGGFSAPRVAYFDLTNNRLKLASGTSNSAFPTWTLAVVDTAIDPGAAGTAVSLALDPTTGNPQIAYRKANTLTFANATSLSGPFQFFSLTPRGIAASMAATPGGVRISHQGLNAGAPVLETWSLGQ
jgi:hypothetical protein